MVSVIKLVIYYTFMFWYMQVDSMKNQSSKIIGFVLFLLAAYAAQQIQGIILVLWRHWQLSNSQTFKWAQNAESFSVYKMVWAPTKFSKKMILSKLDGWYEKLRIEQIAFDYDRYVLIDRYDQSISQYIYSHLFWWMVQNKSTTCFPPFGSCFNGLGNIYLSGSYSLRFRTVLAVRLL